MTRIALLGAFLWLFAAGCGKPSAPSFARYNLDGGRYSVEIEDSGGGTELSFVSSGWSSSTWQAFPDCGRA